MKIFTSAQIRELDQYTIENEPIKSIDLMERSAQAIAGEIAARWSNDTPMVVFAGPGNNGGDALAVARLLAGKNYPISVYLFNVHSKLSENCVVNKIRLVDMGDKVQFQEVITDFNTPEIDENTVIIDGLFGAGINKPITGGFAQLVSFINRAQATVVSIDMPSGLMPENNLIKAEQRVVHADLTLTLQQKKVSMLLADTQVFLGEVKVLDIGLSKEFIDNTDSIYNVLEEDDVRQLLKKRHPFTHKGEMGHALLIAGCYGMSGAAILAARACLRSGAGKVTVHTPRLNYSVMQMAVPEAIMQMDENDKIFSKDVEVAGFSALGIGPGIGKSENTAIAFITQLRRTKCPLVVDADGLNILADHQAWMQQLPEQVIMTPHPKEFDGVCINSVSNCYDRLAEARKLAKQIKGYIMLKGHNTALCMPDGTVFFNPTGNAGMATAGCGDVLTGIITGLLARGYERGDAAKIGMYLHGLAGDIAAKHKGMESLIASDIIQYLPQAFLQLENKQ